MHIFLANKKIEGENETEGVLIPLASPDDAERLVNFWTELGKPMRQLRESCFLDETVDAERLAIFWTELGKRMRQLKENGFFDEAAALADDGISIAPKLAPFVLTGYRVVIKNHELGDAFFGQDVFFFDEAPRNMRYLRWLRGFALEDFGQPPYEAMLSPDGLSVSLVIEPDGEKSLAERVPVLKRTYAEMADVFRRAKERF